MVYFGRTIVTCNLCLNIKTMHCTYFFTHLSVLAGLPDVLPVVASRKCY